MAWSDCSLTTAQTWAITVVSSNSDITSSLGEWADNVSVILRFLGRSDPLSNHPLSRSGSQR